MKLIYCPIPFHYFVNVFSLLLSSSLKSIFGWSALWGETVPVFCTSLVPTGLWPGGYESVNADRLQLEPFRRCSLHPVCCATCYMLQPHNWLSSTVFPSPFSSSTVGANWGQVSLPLAHFCHGWILCQAMTRFMLHETWLGYRAADRAGAGAGGN